MKRGFLLGVGSFLILSTVWLLGQPGVFYQLIQLEPITVAFEAFSLAAGICAIYAAKRVGPNRSWLYALLGWVLGFAAIWAALFVIAGIVALRSLP
jgi:hypothetical protein